MSLSSIFAGGFHSVVKANTGLGENLDKTPFHTEELHIPLGVSAVVPCNSVFHPDTKSLIKLALWLSCDVLWGFVIKTH